ncbi:protein kinase domain-containing protein [Nocardia thailandica]
MLEIGEVFAGFTVERLLGQGGMGTVYLARHPRLDRPTALKLLNRDLFADARVRARFEREADLAAQLDHPAIVTVYDRGTEDEQLWISMQYVDGVDAATVDPMTLPPERAVQIVEGVADALDYAHSRGVLHRDVKPANVLLARSSGGQGERVFLTDFGIARLRADSTHLTQQGMFTATLAYASPEQMTGGDLDGGSDQYSLACTLYWLFTGVAPFDSPDPNEIIRGTMHLAPPPLALRRRGLSPALDAVLAAAMAKHPAYRFESCAAFAAAARYALTHTNPPPLPAPPAQPAQGYGGYYPPAPGYAAPVWPAQAPIPPAAHQHRPAAPVPPAAVPPVVPPQAVPPQGVPPQGAPPQGVPPQRAAQSPVPPGAVAPAHPQAPAGGAGPVAGSPAVPGPLAGVQQAGVVGAPQAVGEPGAAFVPGSVGAEDLSAVDAAAPGRSAGGAAGTASDAAESAGAPAGAVGSAGGPALGGAEPASVGGAVGGPAQPGDARGSEPGGAESGSARIASGAAVGDRAPGLAESGSVRGGPGRGDGGSARDAGDVDAAGAEGAGPRVDGGAEGGDGADARPGDGAGQAGAAPGAEGAGSPPGRPEGAGAPDEGSADPRYPSEAVPPAVSATAATRVIPRPSSGAAKESAAAANAAAETTVTPTPVATASTPAGAAPAGSRDTRARSPQEASATAEPRGRGPVAAELAGAAPDAVPGQGDPAPDDAVPRRVGAPGARADSAGAPPGEDAVERSVRGPVVGQAGMGPYGPGPADPHRHGWHVPHLPVPARMSRLRRFGWVVLGLLVLLILALVTALVIVVAGDDDSDDAAAPTPTISEFGGGPGSTGRAAESGDRVFPTLLPASGDSGTGFRGTRCEPVRNARDLRVPTPLQARPMTRAWSCERTGTDPEQLSYTVIEYVSASQASAAAESVPAAVRMSEQKNGVPVMVRRWSVLEPAVTTASPGEYVTAHLVASFPDDPDHAKYLIAARSWGSSGAPGTPRPSAQEEIAAWWGAVTL